MSFGLAFLLSMGGMLSIAVYIGLSFWVADKMLIIGGYISSIVSLLVMLLLPIAAGIAWGFSNGA